MTAPLDIEGPAAPPRSNGELVFAEPWESRAFGMAVTVYEAGAFTWPQFQAALIARIAAWETAHAQDERYDYYRLWLAALEDVLVGLCAVSTDELTARTRTLAQRPQATTTPTTTVTRTHTDPKRAPGAAESPLRTRQAPSPRARASGLSDRMCWTAPDHQLPARGAGLPSRRRSAAATAGPTP
ncbi:nitrile hydratase accessory protein [Streptomyces sp. NBC_01483]|uniref:nitrile hydratase accessory protein n=1 Tax=Streptomyces sp. NBC_01483 TaxID=2903883 RepID=UPI002E3020C4|nr:nitrile hydratase accessory protein [Streptomyces sp. NBC_01483]